MIRRRRHGMPFGADVLPDGGARFRLWAPRARSVELCRELDAGRSLLPMRAQPTGWFEIMDETATHGMLYRYRIDAEYMVPDPASRHQPRDVHGPSRLVDPERYEWTDADWRGRPWEEAVLYELHVGTFTPEGTFVAAAARLDHLVGLGVTAIELMPVGDFPGKRNWGYDGVLPFAPEGGYGTPDELKTLIDAAHRAGIMVVVDVVYNHFGPDGNYLHRYAENFFSDTRRTPWGAAVNFDGDNSATVRRFFIDNALYWLEEFNADGLRLDAVHAIFDASEPDFLVELAESVRRHTPPGRHVHLLLENDSNAARYLERDAAGAAVRYTAQWNDDWHHACHVLLTGETHGYYADYADDPRAHLLRCMTEGFAYQGEPSAYRGNARRGEPSRKLPSTAFIAFLQNHDQVGNRARGERLMHLAAAEPLRAAVAIQLLAPSIPALFMGEELGCVQPFLYFTDFDAALAEAVREGRRRDLAYYGPRAAVHRTDIPDPNHAETFARCVLDWERATSSAGRAWLAFYRGLLELRRREIVPRLAGTRSSGASPLGARGMVAHWRLGDGTRLRLIANLSVATLDTGRELEMSGAQTLYRQTHHDLRLGTAAVLPPWFVDWSLLE